MRGRSEGGSYTYMPYVRECLLYWYTYAFYIKITRDVCGAVYNSYLAARRCTVVVAAEGKNMSRHKLRVRFVFLVISFFFFVSGSSKSRYVRHMT